MYYRSHISIVNPKRFGWTYQDSLCIVFKVGFYFSSYYLFIIMKIIIVTRIFWSNSSTYFNMHFYYYNYAASFWYTSNGPLYTPSPNQHLFISLHLISSNCRWLTHQRTQYSTFDQNINFNLKEGIHKKNFLWSSRLWVGRRKEPILGYVPKNDEKKNLVHKGLRRDPQKNFLWASRPWVGRRKEPISRYVPKNDE